MAFCESLPKEVAIDVVVEILKRVVVQPLVLVHVSQVALYVADKVGEEHLVVDEHPVVEKGADKVLQLFPVLEVVDCLLQVALQQLVKLVGPDGLHGLVEEPGGLPQGAVHHAKAAFQAGPVAMLPILLVNFAPELASVVVAVEVISLWSCSPIGPLEPGLPRLFLPVAFVLAVEILCFVDEGGSGIFEGPESRLDRVRELPQVLFHSRLGLFDLLLVLLEKLFSGVLHGVKSLFYFSCHPCFGFFHLGLSVSFGPLLFGLHVQPLPQVGALLLEAEPLLHLEETRLELRCLQAAVFFCLHSATSQQVQFLPELF